MSRILNGAYSAPPETEAKVLAAVRDLDYVVNANARALTSATSNTIGLVTGLLDSPFFMAVASGIEEQVAAAGGVLVVVATKGSADREWSALAMLRERAPQAVIMVGGTAHPPQHQARLESAAKAMAATGSRLVSCVRQTADPAGDILEVSYDSEGGSYAATQYLISQGHKRILHLSGPDSYTFTEGRLAGHRRALTDHGIASDPALVDLGPMERREVLGRMTGRVREGLDFSAVLAGNDHMAAAAMRALKDLDLRVPEDVSVVGYNDSALAVDLTPTLTTVHVPQVELGRVAARIGLGQAGAYDGPTKLGTHVVVRDSVSPYRGNSTCLPGRHN